MGIEERAGGSNSVVESQPSKLLVAGSIPVSRSSLSAPAVCGWVRCDGRRTGRWADVAQ